jgi:hypothetical protein
MRSSSSGLNQGMFGRLALAAILTVLVAPVTPVAAQIAITCPADITVSNDPGVCSAVVDYPAPIVTVANPPVTITNTPPSGSTFPVGANEVVCVATDALGNQASCSFTITVEDTEPPVITDAMVNKPVLWPPNHKLVKVTVGYQVADNCDSTPDCALSVSSNEAVDGVGDGNTSPDWEVLDAHHVLVRAERSGTGDGRVYTITITCTDASGNSSSAEVTVEVPHSKGKGSGGQGNNPGGNGNNSGDHGNSGGHGKK